MTFIDMDDVMRANEDTGRYFFSPDTMRFFNSEVVSELIGGRFFITSEQAPHDVARFTVRRANDDGTIGSVGEFYSYDSYGDALEALEEAATRENNDG